MCDFITKTRNVPSQFYFCIKLSTWLILFLSCANLYDIVIAALSWNSICGDILLTFSFHDMWTANIVKLKKYFSIFHFLSKFYTKFPHCMICLHEKANFSQQLYFLYLSSTVLYLQSFLHSLHLVRFLLLPTTTSGLKTSILTTWDRPESTSQLESRQHCLSQNLMIYIAYLEDW